MAGPNLLKLSRALGAMVVLVCLVPAGGAELDTDGDGLSDAEEGAPGEFEVVLGEVTWPDAKADATRRGGYLATITSAEEWSRLVEAISAAGADNFWLGATDEINEGEWRWITGEPFSFALWNFGEPNNCCGGEHFLAVTTNFWNDAGHRMNPESRANYVLEKGLPSDPARPDTDEDGLNDYDEVKVHGTFPYLRDTDEDGYSDYAEVSAGANPRDATNVPAPVLKIFTAVEVEFFTGSGIRYRLQRSTDLKTWTDVGEVVVGNGEPYRRLLSARDGVHFYYRLEKVT